jgi:hypothetical protein
MRRGSVVGRAEIYLSLVDVAAARGGPAPFSRAEQAVKRANLKNGAGRPYRWWANNAYVSCRVDLFSNAGTKGD